MSTSIDIKKKYRYRNGRPARVLCADAATSNEQPVVSLDEDGYLHRHNPDGTFFRDKRVTNFDLVEIREPREFWLVVSTPENDLNPVGTISEFRTLNANQGKNENLDAPFWEKIRVREVIEEGGDRE